jgi:hypothetical protein
LGQEPKQWWSVPVACLVLPSVCCHCGVVVVVKYILYTFLYPCLCFTWTTLILWLYGHRCKASCMWSYLMFLLTSVDGLCLVHISCLALVPVSRDRD